MPSVLLVAIGNPLRGDDGVGQHVLEALPPPPGCEVLCVPQPLPELAAWLTGRERVVFLDAAVGEAGRVELTRIRAMEGRPNPSLAHGLEPAGVVGLAQEVFGARPETYLLTVGGADFGLGTGLSPQVAAAVPEAVDRLRALLESPLSQLR